MLSQLVYVSNRKETCSKEEIKKILDSCKRNNPSLNITGVLLYSDDKFIQLVEGDSNEINALYERIKTDERHQNCVMIYNAPISEKTFPSWHMGSKKIDLGKLSFETNISEADEKFFNEVLLGKRQDPEKVVKTLRNFFK